MKSAALTVLELLAFNVQKFSWSLDNGHAPFSNCNWKHSCKIWRQ